jgi:epoxyqueuosine reductase
MSNPHPFHPVSLLAIQSQARMMGFSDVSVAHFDTLPQAHERLVAWMAQGMQGTMDYLPRNAHIRANPEHLLPQARCALLLRMDYLPQPQAQLALSQSQITEPNTAQVSFYAQGRDYHAVLRQQLKKLVSWLKIQAPAASFRVFTDSAPVMEVELAQASGLGWRGKHTLLLNRTAGSTFFLGGILSTLDLPATPSETHHAGSCGQCTACINICPTRAIIAPYIVDARRCISYLTIEHEGAIDETLRPLMGNRIYGCDDCQTICPWNKFARTSSIEDFTPRNGLDSAHLLTLWAWSEATFLQRLEGSAIRRIGHARWLRNIATALGNALNHSPTNAADIKAALSQQSQHPDAGVREHVAWAMAR